MLPISDAWLTDIATSYILTDNSLPTAQKKWDELPIMEKTWTKWKNYFVDTQSAIERALQSIVGSFGSANATVVFHGMGTSVPANDATIPSSTVDKLDR